MAKVLIVDDSKVITASLAHLFEEVGVECIVASSLKKATKELEKCNFEVDAAILDLALPDAPNGEIVGIVESIDIPVVVLTGNQGQEKEVRDKNNIIDFIFKEGRFSLEYTFSTTLRLIKNQKTKVLIVDDSKVARLQMKELLEYYRLNCIEAVDGVDALKVLKCNSDDIKLVLTDYNMPNMNGLELTREIRKEYKKSQISVVVTTANTSAIQPENFIKAGANGFIYKGFTKESLYLRVSENLDLIDLFQEVNDKANKDFLTGMFNRRYFFDRGETLFEKAKKIDSNINVAMFDIDKFKSINDTYGHDIGDIAIKEVSSIINRYISPREALIARFGGEEYCLLQIGRTAEEFKSLLENIRKAFEINVIKTKAADIKFTVSIGFVSTTLDSLTDMVNAADKALYNAKNNGRNQVQLYIECD